ncbi:MAG: site-2 protease family protein [Defluviitaleaceae bacterium]|nr:site-2 protease family protein [Defluviitaleaceae bacterium]
MMLERGVSQMNLQGILLLVPGAFFAPIIHEFIKARISAALGDPTPKKNGFLTLNPFKYFEPIGFFLLLFFHVGWGRPVPTSPFYYKNKRQGVLLVHGVPMLVNLILGMVAIFLVNILSISGIPGNILYGFGLLSIRLAVFNLFPIAPLAMNKIVQIYSSPSTAMWFNNYEKPLQIVLFLLLLFGIVGLIVGSVSSIFIFAVSI